MGKYVAFLRGINVGGQTVKMEDLRRLFESIGFVNVETFIESGNVIFESENRRTVELEGKIQETLQEALGYEMTTCVRTASELRGIAGRRPFEGVERDEDGYTLYIAFLTDEPTEDARKKLLALETKKDRFRMHGREVYWLSQKRARLTQFSGAMLEQALNTKATLRNSSTVRRIASKLGTAHVKRPSRMG